MAACSKTSEPALPPTYELWPEEGMEKSTYINNGVIQLGVDMSRGGAIFHFSEVNTKRNLLNHVDEGRFVQQSYYGESDGSDWNGTPWVWNPIQGGGSRGQKAPVTYSKIEPTALEIYSTPVLWASGVLESNCQMREKISLQGRVAYIRYMMINRGPTAKDHPSTQQEVPAVFADWDLPNYVFYGGDKPWTNDELTSVLPPRLDLGGTNKEYSRTEHWAAYVDDNGWGVGVYTPGAVLSTTYRFGSGPGGPKLGSCSYFAALRVFGIKEGGVYEYDVYMMIGTLEEMRAEFYKIREAKYKDLVVAESEE